MTDTQQIIELLREIRTTLNNGLGILVGLAICAAVARFVVWGSKK